MSALARPAPAAAGVHHPVSHFRVAFRVLPPERREGILAVYAFCRRADDAVDEAPGPDEARAALARVRAELDRAFAGAEGDAEAARLSRAVAAFRLPRKPFEDLLEGVTWDLENRRYASAGELRAYCYRVASSVGLLSVRVFGCEDPRVYAYAEELGIALQWTNILRDVGEDLARGRVYLTADALLRHRLTEGDLARPDQDVRLRLDGLIRQEAAFARGRFDEAENLLPASERGRLLPGRIMAAVYRVLLEKVERAGSGVLDRRLRVGTARRGLIALGLMARDRLGRGT